VRGCRGGGGGGNLWARRAQENARARHTGGYLQWEGEKAAERRARRTCTILVDQADHEGEQVTRIRPAGMHETKKGWAHAI